MKRSIIYIPLFGLVVSQIVACGPMLKKFVNSKYPPVSSVDKSLESVKNSLTELEKIPSFDLGIHLTERFLDSVLQDYFQRIYRDDPSLGISSIEKIELIKDP